MGSTHNITWNHNLRHVAVGQHRREPGRRRYLDSIAANTNSRATTGTYAWTITGDLFGGSEGAGSWAADSSVTSESAVNFVLSGTIAVTSPLETGDGHARTVIWNHTLGAGQSFDILLSTDGGVTYPTTIASRVGAGATSGSYPWVVWGPTSATASASGLVGVSSERDPGNLARWRRPRSRSPRRTLP